MKARDSPPPLICTPNPILEPIESAAMPFRDVTKEFLEIVHDKTSAIPESKKKKFVPQDISQNGNPTIEKNYVAEAQNIVIVLCLL